MMLETKTGEIESLKESLRSYENKMREWTLLSSKVNEYES